MRYALFLLLLMSGCSTSSQQSTHAKQKAKGDPVQWCNPTDGWGASDGWHQYHCVPDSKGPTGQKGHVEEDKEAEQALADAESHKDNLANALTNRALTDAEMTEVLQYGSGLFTHNMQPFFQDDVDKRFQNALQTQIMIRELAAQEKRLKSK